MKKLKEFNLDKYQLKAVISKRKVNLVLAGAGCGKTYTIVLRIKYLIKYLNVNPKDILCISFTNDSVNSLKNALLKNYNYDIDVFTFHKLALNILKDNKNTIKIFINNSMENKVKRATEFYHMNKEKAEKEISRINKLRANHYKYYTEKDWKEPSNYDICINSDAIGIDNAVNLICDMVKNLIK